MLDHVLISVQEEPILAGRSRGGCQGVLTARNAGQGQGPAGIALVITLWTLASSDSFLACFTNQGMFCWLEAFSGEEIWTSELSRASSFIKAKSLNNKTFPKIPSYQWRCWNRLYSQYINISHISPAVTQLVVTEMLTKSFILNIL